MANGTVVYGGPGFCTLLGLAFIILKLCNVITWSWWWVLAPLWIPTCIVLLILFGMGTILLCTILYHIWKS